MSHPDRVARAPLVNGLIGSGQRASRPARENEVVLNGAEGLDRETLVKCDLMYLVEKDRLHRRQGAVIAARRRALGKRMAEGLSADGIEGLNDLHDSSCLVPACD